MKRIDSNLLFTHPRTHPFIHFFLEFRTNGERDTGPRQTWVKILHLLQTQLGWTSANTLLLN